MFNTTADEVVIAPLLSVDLTVKLAVPGTDVQVKEQGDDASTPTEAPFTKNSTCVTEPSASDAFAFIVTAAGAMYVAEAKGEVIAAVGGVFTATAMFATEEVATKPKLSVALALIVWFPAVAVQLYA